MTRALAVYMYVCVSITAHDGGSRNLAAVKENLAPLLRDMNMEPEDIVLIVARDGGAKKLERVLEEWMYEKGHRGVPYPPPYKA